MTDKTAVTMTDSERRLPTIAQTEDATGSTATAVAAPEDSTEVLRTELSRPTPTVPRIQAAGTREGAQQATPSVGTFAPGGRFGALSYRDFRLAFFGQCISAV